MQLWAETSRLNNKQWLSAQGLFFLQKLSKFSRVQHFARIHQVLWVQGFFHTVHNPDGLGSYLLAQQRPLAQTHAVLSCARARHSKRSPTDSNETTSSGSSTVEVTSRRLISRSQEGEEEHGCVSIHSLGLEMRYLASLSVNRWTFSNSTGSLGSTTIRQWKLPSPTWPAMGPGNMIPDTSAEQRQPNTTFALMLTDGMINWR